jgi:hypothetical protein
LNAKFGKDGAINGIDPTTAISALTYKAEAFNQPVVNERGAGFFSNLVSQSVARSMSDQEAAEVVEVGEVGLLEGGAVKRLNGKETDCVNVEQEECKAK